ncbi:unnamed protein product [Ranitomeya imitator]|uniref:BESS domain-containing protein n=1 Tax=Ranitomeya imitator TaxID=111125 RepID=A0ABN9M1P6_9NEOB|nr:unnamed protein product [Ranitomeya imitator]
MVWGGISLEGRTVLHVLARGSLTAIRYRDEIIRPLVRPYADVVSPGFLLMQDNARPHVAGVCQQFLQNEGIEAMDWPTRSPDLNPIEHIWDIMARTIHQCHVALQTVQELADALIQDGNQVDNVTRDRRSCQDQNPRETMQNIKSGLSAKKKRPYIYFERLSLLSSIIEQHPSKSNVQDVDPALEEEALDISATEEVEELEKTEEVTVATSTSTAPEPANVPSCSSRWSHKRKGLTTSTVTEFDTRVLDYLSRLINDDGEESFCRSLVPYVRRVPEQIRLRTRAALQIVVQAAIPPNDPIELFTVLEHWQQTGYTMVNTIIPPPATGHSHMTYSRPHRPYRTVAGSELDSQFHPRSERPDACALQYFALPSTGQTKYACAGAVAEDQKRTSWNEDGRRRSGPETPIRPDQQRDLPWVRYIGGLSTALQNAVDKPLMPVGLPHPRFSGNLSIMLLPAIVSSLD